jgi:putative transcriptional regulator
MGTEMNVTPEPIDPETEIPPSLHRLAALVRRYREDRGWSQGVLAETLQIDHNAVSRLELGQYDPPFSLVANLVRVLDLPIEDAVFNRIIASRRRRAREGGVEETVHDS